MTYATASACAVFMPAFCRSLAAPNVSNVVVLMAAMIAKSKQLVTCQLGELRGDHPLVYASAAS